MLDLEGAIAKLHIRSNLLPKDNLRKEHNGSAPKSVLYLEVPLYFNYCTSKNSNHYIINYYGYSITTTLMYNNAGSACRNIT